MHAVPVQNLLLRLRVGTPFQNVITKIVYSSGQQNFQ